MKLKYNRNLQELESKACKWWPQNLKDFEADSSIIPLLIETQDKFISILTLSKQCNPFGIFDIIVSSDFPANLFLKHLIVLSDFGSENLQRINRDFSQLFPKSEFTFLLSGKKFKHKFSTIPVKGTLNNLKMHIDARKIQITAQLSDFYKDLIVLLLFGGCSVNDRQSDILSKCEIGNMLGKTDELTVFIKQRYIHVSRITAGAKANALGPIAQSYVFDFLKSHLDAGYEIKTNSHIPAVTQNEGKTLTSFDIVVSKNKRHVAIEISFQVTTNSVIERKSGQATERLRSVENSGNFIAYIIDGAGNFQRSSAINTICNNSHCTVAYTEAELALLISFIREKLK